MSSSLEHYQQLVYFLGQTLSQDYEIVLHWLDTTGSFSIAAIEHAEISGRTLNSPITGYALQLVHDEVYKEQNFIANYKAATGDKKIQGSTFFIKDETNQLLGLLCINFDNAAYTDLMGHLATIARIPDLTDPQPIHKSPTTEVLHTSVADIIYAVIDRDLLRPGTTLTQQKKIELCAQLSEKGVFQIKGAIPQVAQILNVSEPSVYRYLKRFYNICCW